MDPREELNAELKKARAWILGVGILMVIVDQIMFAVQGGWDIPFQYVSWFFIIDGVILVVFVTLWWWAKSQPKLACILALVAFWGIQLAGAVLSGDPANLFKGIIVKVLFTVALVNGIKSGARASQLQEQLGKVFE